MKKFLSAVFAAAMLTCALPAASAASDIDTHWAKDYILALHDLGVVNPSASDNSYLPDKEITRAEFMRYINRAFGFTEKANINFSDVDPSDWFYETVQIAVRHGYINGVSNDRMSPEGTLTREQAATIIGRLHKYTPTGTLSTLQFSDKGEIGDWSISYIADAVEKGYIDGFTDGTFKPQGLITRGQIAKILYFFLGTPLNLDENWYTEGDLQTDTINASVTTPCSLADVTIPGNLYITEGVGTGDVALTNVTIKGDLIIAGGEITMDGVGVKRMIVSNPLGMEPQITCIGNSNVAQTEVQSSATLRESNLGVSASGLSDLTLNGDNLSLTLDGAVWNISANKPATILTSGSTSINSLIANAKTTITGGGTVDSAILNASGCSLIMQPGSYELASGVTATLAGQTVASTNSIAVSPATLNINLGNASSLAHSYDFTFNADKEDLLRIVCDGKNLELGSDYNLLSNKNGIRLYTKFLTSLKTNTCTLQLVFTNGDRGEINISSNTTAAGMVTPSSLFFDRYEESPNYSNQTLTLTLPTGVQLNSVKISSTVLERGTDYTFNSATGALVLLRETLAKKTTGTYTISFVPNRGSSLTCSLTVTDTSPKNEVVPEEVDFDANAVSGGYNDVSVTLNTADGATLKSISCGSKTLEEDWQYRIEGNTVIINKSAIASFSGNKADHADFTFVMSSGRSPILRINFVTTYALTATVVDDLGLPISNATVSFAPTDASTGSAIQTATTDSDGIAKVYVKRGSYVITANDNRFTEPISQTVTASSSRNVKLVGEILENVSITVTNSFGAKLSGAIVTIGGKSVTTGADGVASFSVKRSSYTVQVACTGYETKTQSLTVNESIQARIMLD